MSKNQRKQNKTAENKANTNSDLSPEEQKMLESLTKRIKLIKKSPLINVPKSTSILKNNGKSIVISARKVGRQRLRQVTRWDTSDADSANAFLQQDPGMLDRSRFRTPANK